MASCPVCGLQVSESSTSCVHCGSDLSKGSSHKMAAEWELARNEKASPPDKHPVGTSGPRKCNRSLVFLGFALLATIVYGWAITLNRNGLNVELSSATAELSSAMGELSVAMDKLSVTETKLQNAENKLQLYSIAMDKLSVTETKLQNAENKLQLYKETLGIDVFSDVQPPYSKPSFLPGVTGPATRLKNNNVAKNPTWQQLTAFLNADYTDRVLYSRESFNCTNFAEMVHNNAEYEGIRAAFVAVQFENDPEGHALNAFVTTDKGLVYVDCTGVGRQTSPLQVLLGIGQPVQNTDKIAYVVKGKELGAISMGGNVPLDYTGYETLREKTKTDSETYAQKLQAYNLDVLQYNREISGKVYTIGTADWLRINERKNTLTMQEKDLRALEASLAPVWEPMGLVASIELYW